MPDRRNPPFGSTDWAAKQFLHMLEREEREKELTARRKSAAYPDRGSRPVTAASSRAASISHREFPDVLDDGPETVEFPTSKGKSDSRAVAPPKGRQGPPRHLGGEPYTIGHPASLLDLIGVAVDDAGGFEGNSGQLQEYGAVTASTAESVASQLPGREHGPADAYRHILWAAELTRRFGERRVRELLKLHEVHGQRTGQRPDESDMDMRNNDIGVQIGIGARTFDDVVRASRKVIGASLEDGSGLWKASYDPSSTMAPHGAAWLDESRWKKNPRVQLPPPKAPFRGPYPMTRETADSESNWYANPKRPNGPDWVAGYVAEPYQYPFGSPSNRTGPNDPTMLRAIDLYRSYINRPWLRWLGEQF